MIQVKELQAFQPRWEEAGQAGEIGLQDFIVTCCAREPNLTTLSKQVPTVSHPN